MSESEKSIGRYSCSQLLGYQSRSQKLLEDEDNITTLKFDQTGRFLALADRMGQLVILQSP